ncbi:MAG: hypothetical protein ACE5EB_01365 [Thermodesulfobacteriota bacterium]
MTGLLQGVESVIGSLGPVQGFFSGGQYYGAHGDSMPVFFAVVFFFILVLAAALLILWIAMPFSVFALKGLLKQCIREQEKTNALLRVLIEKKEEPRKTGEDDGRSDF